MTFQLDKLPKTPDASAVHDFSTAGPAPVPSASAVAGYPGKPSQRAPRVSVRWDPSIAYPPADHFFSPDAHFPEYAFDHLAAPENRVYGAVRACLSDAGLDPEHWNTPAWNPLGAYIRPGDRVFVLCNFVQHNDREHSPERFWAKCTHGSVLRAVLDYVLLALQGHGELCFGNAPIQSCEWSNVLRETGAGRVEEFYRTRAGRTLPVRSLDLRHHVVGDGALGGLRVLQHVAAADCVEVDLGQDSLLEQLYDAPREPQFRVLDYDPGRIQRCHAKGKHLYLLHRRILESDVIVSVPKLKTHEKVGMTGGIKGCVGAVAHKDCLAHHRVGSPAESGDDYPDRLRFLAPISVLHDMAYAARPGWGKTLAYIGNVFARKAVRQFTRCLGGSWPGNDTCWRMALDLARIIQFADQQGVVRTKAQRGHIMVTDGVISGEGDGPLSATPVRAGYVAFADDIVAGDMVNARAMGFDPSQIPLLREALRTGLWGSGSSTTWDLKLNGLRVTSEEFSKHVTRSFVPPREWRKLLGQMAG